MRSLILVFLALITLNNSSGAESWQDLGDSTVILGFQNAPNLFRSTDGTLHLALWARTRPDVAYKSFYLHRSRSTAGVITKSSTLIGEVETYTSPYAALSENADQSLNLFVNQDYDNASPLTRLFSNVDRSTWSKDATEFLSTAFYRRVQALTESSGYNFHYRVNPDTEGATTAIVKFTAPDKTTTNLGTVALNRGSASLGAANFPLAIDSITGDVFASWISTTANGASIKYQRVRPTLGTVKTVPQSKRLGTGLENYIWSIEGLLGAQTGRYTLGMYDPVATFAARVGAGGLVSAFRATTKSELKKKNHLHKELILWRSDTDKAVTIFQTGKGGIPKGEFYHVGVAPAPDGKVWIYFTVSPGSSSKNPLPKDIYVSLSDATMTTFSSPKKIAAPLAKKSYGVTQISADGRNGPLDMAAVVFRLSDTTAGTYLRRIP